MPKTKTVSQTVTPQQTIQLTVTLSLPYSVEVAEGHFVMPNLAKLAETPAALERVVRYGIDRFTRDGTTKIKEGKELRDATSSERQDLANAKWDRLLSGELKQRAASGDPILGEARALAIRFLVKSGIAAKAIGKLPTREAIAQALSAHEGIYEKILKRAEALAQMKSEEL